MEETALKMKQIIGVGPITKESVEHFNRRVKDIKLARQKSFCTTIWTLMKRRSVKWTCWRRNRPRMKLFILL